MKSLWIGALGLVIIGLALAEFPRKRKDVVEVGTRVALSGVEHVGINVGLRTSWGAEQLISNVIMNPGFEGIVDRTLIEAGNAKDNGFTSSSVERARPDGFWSEAAFDVRTGAAAGETGVIQQSRRGNSDGLPDFTTNRSLAGLRRGDILALTRISDREPLTQWWFVGQAGGRVTAEQRPGPPGSPGHRSAVFRPRSGHPATLSSYLDAIGERGGKMLPVRGGWRLSFWARGETGSHLACQLRRAGNNVLFRRDLRPCQNWTHYDLPFSGKDDGPPGFLELQFQATGDREVLLDEVELRRQSDRDPFRTEVIAVLQKLRPAYLRDWQGQLGDSLENRLSPPFARRASRYRPGSAEATDFGYSLPEFLDLCKQVQAKPWIVAPTTFSDQEWIGLGKFLNERWKTDHFAEIVVEFGNENWNSTFRSAGIADPGQHGQAAQRALAMLRTGADKLPLRWAVNGQYANPELALRVLESNKGAAMLAVSPYLLPDLSANTPLLRRMSLLFPARDSRLAELADGVSRQGRELAVAEVNLHTVGGDAPALERTALVGGVYAGSALAKRILEALQMGVRRQCVYTLAQYDTRAQNGGYVPLWGITRDLGATCRLRPTGLAVMMLNQAVGGDLFKASGAGANLLVAPFSNRDRWSAAIVSSLNQEREITLRFPTTVASKLPQRVLWLKESAAGATNEDSEEISIAAEDLHPANGVIRLSMRPWGFAVLLPGERI